MTEVVVIDLIGGLEHLDRKALHHLHSFYVVGDELHAEVPRMGWTVLQDGTLQLQGANGDKIHLAAWKWRSIRRLANPMEVIGE